MRFTECRLRAFVFSIASIVLLETTSAGAEDLAPLPDSLPANRIALRVLAPDSSFIRIEDIAEILVFIEPDSRWRMGPKPEIDSRYADGWVTVDASMYTLAKPGMKTQLGVKSDFGAAVANGEIDPASLGRITYHTDADPKDIGISLKGGPDKVAADEVAGRVVDADGKPVAGALVRFPDGFEDLKVAWNRPPIREPVTTDADGIFRFGDFAHQHYIYLQVNKDGFAPRWITDLPVGKGFAVRLDSTTRATGNLKRIDGSPAADAKIKFVTIGRRLAFESRIPFQISRSWRKPMRTATTTSRSSRANTTC